MTEAETLIEQFKSGMDPDSAAKMAERVSTAEARVAQLEAEREVPGSSEQVETLSKQIDELTSQRDAAIASLTEEQKAHKATAKVAKLPVEAKPRSLGPIADGKALDRDALKAAILDADQVEIAFSDGKKEVKGLAPVAVSGTAWKDHPVGLMMTEKVDLVGPTSGADWIIEGYALLLDGKQVAFTALDTPLRIRTGAKVQIADDIHF